MILDKNLLVSDAQDLAQTAAAYLSTYSIDLGVAGTIPGIGGTPVHDIGRGGVPELLCQVVTAFSTGSSPTVLFELVTATDAALTGTLTVICATPAIAAATLVVGYQVRLAIPAGITQRYLGMRYTIGTATTTTGKVTAGLVWNKQTNPSVVG